MKNLERYIVGVGLLVVLVVSVIEYRNKEKSHHAEAFRDETTFSYALDKTGPVQVEIYTARGDTVCTLLQDVQSAGDHHLVWDGKDAKGNDMKNGVYLLRMQAIGVDQTQKMMLLR